MRERTTNRVSTVPVRLPVDPVPAGVLTENRKSFLSRFFYVISPAVLINDQPERQPT
jgi:hypothetical protein